MFLLFIYSFLFKVVLKFQTCPSECSSTETSAMPIELGYEKICCSSAVLDSLNSSTTSDTSQATSSDDPQSSSTIVFRNDDKGKFSSNAGVDQLFIRFLLAVQTRLIYNDSSTYTILT